MAHGPAMEFIRWLNCLPPSRSIGSCLDPDVFDSGPNLFGGGIREDRLARLIGKPDTYRQCVQHRAELAFAALQCLFGPLTVRDVLDNRDMMNRHFARPPQWCDVHVNPHNATIFSHVAFFPREGGDLAGEEA